LAGGKKKDDIDCGAMPVDDINRTLGTELDPGEVVFYGHAQAHAERRHPKDYEACLPHVGDVISAPSYVGDDVKNPGKIELIRKIPALGAGLLVAVTLEPDDSGRYVVCSVYPISHKTIENRRQAQTLLVLRTK